MSEIDLLRKRVDRLEKREALSGLVARYGLLLDDRDWDGVASCFTRDGRLMFSGGEVVGRVDLKAFYERQLSKNEFTFHYPHSHVFTSLEDDRASGVVTAHAEHGRSGTCVLAAVRYQDQYRHEAGEWRLASREIVSRYCLGWSELDGSYHEGALTALMRG